MKEQHVIILQLRSHIRKFWMQGTNGPQCIEMSMISTNHVMRVNTLEGWLHRVWLG
jgi:hypothetical protein